MLLRIESSQPFYNRPWKRGRTLQRLWFNHFNRDLDDLPTFYGQYGREGVYDILKDHFLRCKWYELYDFLEVLALDRSNLLVEKTRQWINRELEEHNSAYRFVEAQIAEITDVNEIEAIESALSSSEAPVRAHLDASLQMLSNKENPDYRNSVKEAISAVEAACRLVTGNRSATLGDALKRIDNVHPAMSQAFSRLYGFTNDASGIRHSLTDESTISYADAKFMLIACSAFVSYLKMTADA